MEVAYLIKQQRRSHAILHPNRDVDDVGLLKARTYLAFLRSKRVLKQEDRGEWNRIYYDANLPLAFDPTAFNDPAVVAAVAYLPFAEIWEQPGVAMVKKDLEQSELFNNVYLRSSIHWLAANNNRLQQIEEQFSKRLEIA